MITVQEVIAVLEEFAPLDLAESWDNVGLLIGSLTAPVKRILVSLDVNDDVVNEAIDNHIDLIIAHHPIIFKAQKSIVTHQYNQNMYIKLIQHNISVYAAHTNLDNAPNGMNQWLAEALALEHIEVMEEIGKTVTGVTYGTGRVGKLSEPMCLGQFVDYVSQKLTTSHVRYAGNPQTCIQTVAICGGAGQSYYHSALHKQADVYITGDVTYHVAQNMLENQLAFIDAGHYIEAICKEKLCEIYQQWVKENALTLECIVSDVNTDPFIFRK